MHELALFNAIPQTTLPALPAVWQEQIAGRAEQLRAASKALNTRRAYASDWRQWTAWCQFAGVPALPASAGAIVGYLTSLTMSKTPHGKPYASQTISRRLAAIAHFHREAGAADPTRAEGVRVVMEGIRRENATRPTGAKAALLTSHMRKALRRAPTKPAATRDRALLLIGFAGCFRRSELVGLNVEDLQFDEEGRLRIRLLKSKTNQTGQEECTWIAPGGELCPVKSLKEWLRVSGITAGAVFRGVDRHGNVGERLSTDAVCYIVKRAGRLAGLDPARVGGHSLRIGHVTQSFVNETPAHLIQRQGRWRSMESVMRYNRDVDAARNNSSGRLGL